MRPCFLVGLAVLLLTGCTANPDDPIVLPSRGESAGTRANANPSGDVSVTAGPVATNRPALAQADALIYSETLNSVSFFDVDDMRLTEGGFSFGAARPGAQRLLPADAVGYDRKVAALFRTGLILLIDPSTSREVRRFTITAREIGAGSLQELVFDNLVAVDRVLWAYGRFSRQGSDEYEGYAVPLDPALTPGSAQRFDEPIQDAEAVQSPDGHRREFQVLLSNGEVRNLTTGRVAVQSDYPDAQNVLAISSAVSGKSWIIGRGDVAYVRTPSGRVVLLPDEFKSANDVIAGTADQAFVLVPAGPAFLLMRADGTWTMKNLSHAPYTGAWIKGLPIVVSPDGDSATVLSSDRTAIVPDSPVRIAALT